MPEVRSSIHSQNGVLMTKTYDMQNVSLGYDAVYKMVEVTGGEWVSVEDYNQLRGNLSLAEEGLASAMQEKEQSYRGYRAELEALQNQLADCTEACRLKNREIEQLQADNEKLNDYIKGLPDEPEAIEPPYYVRTFWSPDRKHLVTANCDILEGEANVTLSLQDDNGDVWEATGPTTDLTSQGSQSGETEPQLNAPGSDAPITGTSAKDAGTRNAEKSRAGE